MGGCASKPKEFNNVVEAPIMPEKPHPETADHDDTNGGENKTEKPLVDISESKEAQSSSSDEPKASAAAAEPVSSKAVVEAAKPKEDDVKAASKNDDDGKVKFTDNITVEPVKKAEVDHKSNATPSKEEVRSN